MEISDCWAFDPFKTVPGRRAFGHKNYTERFMQITPISSSLEEFNGAIELSLCGFKKKAQAGHKHKTKYCWLATEVAFWKSLLWILQI